MNAPILVATDFSPRSESALQWAARLAHRLGAELHVAYINEALPPLTDLSSADTGMAQMSYRVLFEEEERRAQTAFADHQATMAQSFAGLACTYEYRVATDLADELERLSEARHPLLVVLGTHQRTHDNDRWDSHGLQFLRRSRHPLVMVPEHSRHSVPQRALLAWDGGAISAAQQAALGNLPATLGCSLEVVHVRRAKEQPVDASLLGPLAASFREIEAEDVNEGLVGLANSGQYDLLFLLPHHHSVWERFFFKLHTPELVSRLELPVCCLPEG